MLEDVQETFIVGVDGSDCARRAAEFAAQRARRTGARLVLLGVIEWSRYSFYTPEELETRARDRGAEIERVQARVLQPLADALTDAVEGALGGLEIRCMVRHGHAADVIRAVAEEERAAQIFIGRQGRSSFGDAFFGGVTNRIVSIAPVPVTVVP